MNWNQKERALQALDCYDINDLEQVIGEAQNRPPQGDADGSISEELWRALRDFVQAWRVVERADDLARELASK